MYNIIHAHNATEASYILRFSRDRRGGGEKNPLYTHTFTHAHKNVSLQNVCTC